MDIQSALDIDDLVLKHQGISSSSVKYTPVDDNRNDSCDIIFMNCIWVAWHQNHTQ